MESSSKEGLNDEDELGHNFQQSSHSPSTSFKVSQRKRNGETEIDGGGDGDERDFNFNVNTVIGKNNSNSLRIQSIQDNNLNKYTTIKTITQGLMDIALLTANISQLKFIVQVGTEHSFYYPLLILICASVFLQITSGVCLVWIGTTEIDKVERQGRANTINNLIAIQIFLITAFNIIIASLGFDHEGGGGGGGTKNHSSIL